MTSIAVIKWLTANRIAQWIQQWKFNWTSAFKQIQTALRLKLPCQSGCQSVRDLLFSWAISCSSALAYLADLNPAVAHGNVRPSNLLLCAFAVIIGKLWQVFLLNLCNSCNVEKSGYVMMFCFLALLWGTNLELRLSPCGALSPVEHRHQAEQPDALNSNQIMKQHLEW